MGANRRRFPAPMARLEPGGSSGGAGCRSARSFGAAGRPSHQARLVCPVVGNGAARGSCGRADGGPGQPTAPPGAPGEGNAAALVCFWDMERAVPVRQDPRSTVEPPCPRAPEPGGGAPMDCFHSDTDTTGPTFTAMPPHSRRCHTSQALYRLRSGGIPVRTPLRPRNSPSAPPRVRGPGRTPSGRALQNSPRARPARETSL